MQFLLYWYVNKIPTNYFFLPYLPNFNGFCSILRYLFYSLLLHFILMLFTMVNNTLILVLLHLFHLTYFDCIFYLSVFI